MDSPTKTHILKPGILETRYPHLTLNEFLCLRAAVSCGIPTAEVAILYPQNPLLAVKRYDRAEGQKSNEGFFAIQRLHQEDCCQACGIISENKYERDGGPGFADVRNLLVKHSLQPSADITTFITLGLFNYLIGNCDAHAKNYSLLQNANATVSLAPAYDLICTTIYDGKRGQKLSRSMGMSIGSHENIDRISPEDFKQFAKDLRINLSSIKEISEMLLATLPTAFQKASEEATVLGFHAAEELTKSILEDTKSRTRILRAL